MCARQLRGNYKLNQIKTDKNKLHPVSINNIYEYYSDHKKYIITDIRNVSLLSEKYNELYSVMKLSTYLTLKLIPYIIKCFILYIPFLIFFATNKNIIITILSIIISILIDIFVISYINIVYNGIINKNSVFIPDEEFNKVSITQNEDDILSEPQPYFIYKGKCII
jgi:hypothetical protein